MTLRSTSRTATTTAAFLGLTLALAACSSDDEENPPAETQSEEAPESEETPETEDDAPEVDEIETEDEGDEDEEAGDGGGATAEETVVEIGETIEDPDMGDTVEVLSAVRDFPSEEQAELISEGGEVVLVEVTIVPGDEYGGRLSVGNFDISWDDGADFWGDKTRLVEEEMDAAGYPPLEDVSRRDGGEHTGWAAFFVDERSDSYLLRYERPGAEVIGSDETIDEFTTELEIPAS